MRLTSTGDTTARPHILLALATVAGLLVITALALGMAVPANINGAPRPQTVTYTVTTAEDIHRTPGGTCTSGPSDDLFTVTLWDTAGVQRIAPMSAGRQVEERCAFTVTMPMLRDARWLAFNGAYHEVPAGVGLVDLSADDGDWHPVKSMAGLR